MQVDETLDFLKSDKVDPDTQFVTIYECSKIVDLDLIKLALGHADIPFRVQHENALRLGNIPAVGFHGALIQVDAHNVDEARQLLLDQGFKLEVKLVKSPFFNWLEKRTSHAPIIKSWPVAYRFIFILWMLLFLAYLVLALTVDPFR